MTEKSKKPACFSTKIDVKLAEKLKQDLYQQGFKLCQPPYTIFSAVKKGVTCTLYESGSLVVQGKDKEEFIEFYLEPEILENFSYTHPLVHIDKTARIGIDEAGKGDFFGSLCTAGLYADEKGIEKLVELGVKDSKRFSDKKILSLAEQIEKTFVFTVIKIGPEKYNELYEKFGNLNHLLAWCHVTAIQNLNQKTQCRKVIIDQFAGEHLVERFVKQKHLDIDLEQRVRGEEDVVVAGASILARSTFLKELEKQSKAIGHKLPKGAGSVVIETGKKIIAKFNTEMLDKISKKHFKTREEILNALSY